MNKKYVDKHFLMWYCTKIKSKMKGVDEI